MSFDKTLFDLETIQDNFKFRIKKTNFVYDKLFLSNQKEDDLEIRNIIYFNYYFDFSTAIESLIRGIGCFSCKPYIEYYTQPLSESKGFFLKLEELETFVDTKKISNYFSKYRVRQFLKLINNISPLKQFKPNFKFNNINYFKNCYKECLRQRNLLAHGLAQRNSNIQAEYTNDQLVKFYYVYYFLLIYYKEIKKPN